MRSIGGVKGNPARVYSGRKQYVDGQTNERTIYFITYYDPLSSSFLEQTYLALTAKL